MARPGPCDHDHPVTKDGKLVLVLFANLAMVVALVIVGLASHSLGVLAAGGDYLGDAAGVALSLLALRISRHRRGHPRAPTYAALVNATLLLAVTGTVMVEALTRLISGPPRVEGLPVLVVSVIAGAVMAVCALVIGTVESDDLNMRSVVLDTLADGASAAGVAVSGAIILAADSVYWLDSAVALAIATIVAYHATRLLRDVLARLRGEHEEARLADSASGTSSRP
jgi:cobalt-zinc-cadmium efflux system protein